MLIIMGVWIRTVFADPDVVAQNYSAAQSAGLNSCTSGYDLLAGDVQYGKQMIKGGLPYTLAYKAPLRRNETATVDFEIPFFTTSGWRDNYSNYTRIITNSRSLTTYVAGINGYGQYIMHNTPVYEGNSFNLLLMAMPGDTTTTAFKEDTLGNGTKVFARLYSADPAGEIQSSGATENLNWNSDLGETSLSKNNTAYMFNRHGVNYKIDSETLDAGLLVASTQWAYLWYVNGSWYSGVADTGSINAPPTLPYTTTNNVVIPKGAILYNKFVVRSVESYRRVTEITATDGRKLALNYDNRLNMLQVSDNRNNVLTFEHNFRENPNSTAAQTNDEKQPITAVTLASGVMGDKQRATFKYGVFNVRASEGSAFWSHYYSLIESDSPIAGKNMYTITPTMNGAVVSLARRFVTNFNASNTPDSDYYLPILTQVKNALGQVEQQWNITQNYQVTATGAYTTAQTTLTSYKPGGNGVADALKTTTVYDDLAKTIKMTTSPDGTATATTNITTVVNSANDITINASGYPCLTSNGKPVSSVHVTTDRSHISDVTDARGIKTAYTYDTRNRVTSVTEAVGLAEQRVTTYQYTTLYYGQPNIFTTPNTINSPAFTVTNTLNVRGQIISQKVGSPLAGSVEKTVSYTYFEDATKPNYGLLQRYVGPRNTTAFDDSMWYSYDNYGNLSSKGQVVKGVGRNTSYQNYNSAGQPNFTLNPDGTSTLVVFDSGYRVTDSTYGTWNGTTVVGQLTHNVYNTLGQLTSTTNPNYETTNYGYDAIGRLRTTTYANGNLEINYYFPNGQINAVGHHGADGTLAQSEWQTLDGNGRVYTQRKGGADRNWVAINYDANGNVVQTRTTLGIIESWTYDALNHVKTHTDGNGNVDTKAYTDNADNETDANAANGAGSQRVFKNGHVLAKETNSDFNIKEYTYDLADQVILQLHGDYRECAFNNRDQLGRTQNMLCRMRNGWNGWNTSDPNLIVSDTYNYDQSAFGRLNSVVSNTAGANPVTGKKIGVDTSYTYDVYGRVTSKTQVNNTPVKWGYAASQQKNSYIYMGGKIKRIIYPSGNEVSYEYKSSGEINAIAFKGGKSSDWLGYVLKTIIDRTTYDGANRLRGWTWGDYKAKTQIDRDDAGLTTQIYYDDGTGNTSNFKEVYGYDNDGRMTTRQFTGTDSGTFGYAYDNNSQIVTESRVGNIPMNYVYDKNGNRLKVKVNFPLYGGYDWYGDHLTYDKNRLLSWRRGNDDTPLSMHYDYGGEIQETPLTIDQTGDSKNYLLTSRATYDYAGRRRAEGAVPNSTKYTGMFMDYNHKNERTFRGGSNIDRQYAYDEASHLIGEYTASGAMIVEYIWMDDKPVAAVFPNNRIVYLITDWQNKPRLGIDAVTKRNVWQWNPKAFGWPNATTNDYAITINLRFPGQYYDEQSGLYYNHNRYYSPQLGRYMEPDPIGLEGGLNPYAYAGNNPVMNVDPSGLMFSPLDDAGMTAGWGDYGSDLDRMLTNQSIQQSQRTFNGNGPLTSYGNTQGGNSGLLAQGSTYIGPNYMQQFSDLYNYAGQQIKKGIYSVGETANTVGDYGTIPFPAAGLPLKYTGLGLMFATTDTPKALALQEGVGLFGGVAGKRLGKIASSDAAYSDAAKGYIERSFELYHDKLAKFTCQVYSRGCE